METNLYRQCHLKLRKELNCKISVLEDSKQLRLKRAQAVIQATFF